MVEDPTVGTERAPKRVRDEIDEEDLGVEDEEDEEFEGDGDEPELRCDKPSCTAYKKKFASKKQKQKHDK